MEIQSNLFILGDYNIKCGKNQVQKLSPDEL